MPLGKILKLLIGGFQQKPLDANTSELPTTAQLTPAPTESSEISPCVPSVVLSETPFEILSEILSETLLEISSKPVCEDSPLLNNYFNTNTLSYYFGARKYD